jgi:protein-disulfide isomerase
VQAFYEQYKAQLNEQPLDVVRSQIVAHLQKEQEATALTALVQSLAKQTDIAVSLSPPTAPVAAVGPSRGEERAAVTIVEFADFECAACERSAVSLQKLLQRYKGNVRWVYRQAPQPRHPHAREAAEAASCATDAGKFWAYHDLLVQNPQALRPDALKRYAAQVGVNEATFSTCLASDKTRAAVDKDAAEAAALGVSQTPTYFVNGRPLYGEQSYEALQGAIDEALAAQRPGKPAIEPPAVAPKGKKAHGPK